MLAGVGLIAVRRDRALAPWRLILPLALALATMVEWAPDAFYMILQLPGLGWFRAPARYTLLTSLALVLFAGRGFDHAIAAWRFWTGLMLAVCFGTAAWVWSTHLAQDANFRAGMGADTLDARFFVAGAAWVLGLLAIIGWRRNLVGAWAPLLLTALELGGLFFTGPVAWHQMMRLPEASPLLERLAVLPDVGLVAGRLLNLPVDGGQTAAYPNLGIAAPPPNYLLEPATVPPGQNTEADRHWQRRFGVTHGVWAAGDDIRDAEVVAEVADPALDQMVPGSRGPHPAGGPGRWKLVRRTRGAFPPAWISRHVRTASSWGQLYTELSRSGDPNEAWFLAEDNLPPVAAARARREPMYRAGMARRRSSSTMELAYSS